MQFLLGVQAIFHVAFIPGFITLYWLRQYSSLTILILASFVLSPLLNFLLFFATVGLGVYSIELMHTISILEFGCLLFILWSQRSALKNWIFKNQWIEVRVSTLISILVLAFYLYLYCQNFGDIFRFWDTLFSWDRWAISWMKGSFPTTSLRYPQLIPTAYARIYLLQSHSALQFFHTAYSGLFFLALGLAPFLLRQVRSFALPWLTVFITVLLQIGLFHNQLHDYAADIPVLSLCYIAFVFNLLGLERYGTAVSESRRLFLFSALAMTAALCTKQIAVLYIVFNAPFNLYYVRFVVSGIQEKDCLKDIFYPQIFIILFALPWYVLKQIHISQGLDVSELTSNGHIGMPKNSIAERFQSAFLRLRDTYLLKSALSLWLCGVFLVLSFRNKVVAFINVFFNIPVLLLWFFYASYAVRNVIIIAPFLSLAIAEGIAQILLILRIRKIRLKDADLFRVPRLSVITVIVSAISIIIYHNRTQLSSAGMEERQFQLQIRLGEYGLNQKLFEYFQSDSPQSAILSDVYPFIYCVPIVEDQAVFKEYRTVEAFLLDWRRKTYSFFLYSPNISRKDFVEYLRAGIDRGEFKVVMNYGNYVLLKQP